MPKSNPLNPTSRRRPAKRNAFDDLLEAAVAGLPAWSSSSQGVPLSSYVRAVNKASGEVAARVRAVLAKLENNRDSVQEDVPALKARIKDICRQLGNIPEGIPAPAALNVLRYRVCEQVPVSARSRRTLTADLTLDVTGQEILAAYLLQGDGDSSARFSDEPRTPLGAWKPKLLDTPYQDTWRFLIAPAGYSTRDSFARMQELRTALSGDPDRFLDMGIENYQKPAHSFGFISDDPVFCDIASKQGFMVMPFQKAINGQLGVAA